MEVEGKKWGKALGKSKRNERRKRRCYIKRVVRRKPRNRGLTGTRAGAVGLFVYYSRKSQREPGSEVGL